jgi:hypothetical protein
MKNNIIETRKEELTFINLTVSEKMEEYLRDNLCQMEEPLLCTRAEYYAGDVFELLNEIKEGKTTINSDLSEEFENVIKELETIGYDEFFYINEERGNKIEEVAQ